jgi:hypothetical protein
MQSVKFAAIHNLHLIHILSFILTGNLWDVCRTVKKFMCLQLQDSNFDLFFLRIIRIVLCTHMENTSTTLLPTATEKKVCQLHLTHPKLGMVPICNKIPLTFSI